MIPNADCCFKLLGKYGIYGVVLRHCIMVNKVALFFGKQLTSNGIKVDMPLLNAASLLHDIGKKLADDTDLNHVEARVKILEDEEFMQVANVVMKHSVNSVLKEDTMPLSWGEKLVFYADRIVSVDERIDDLMVRHPDIKRFISRIRRKTFFIEDEIISIIGNMALPSTL